MRSIYIYDELRIELYSHFENTHFILKDLIYTYINTSGNNKQLRENLNADKYTYYICTFNNIFIKDTENAENDANASFWSDDKKLK